MRIASVDDSTTLVRTTRIDDTRIEYDPRLIRDQFRRIIHEDAFYLIDRTVYELYETRFTHLRSSGRFMLMEGGDEHKSASELSKIIDALYDARISRKGTLYAIGGGVITDMGGLASNLFFRGIRSILIPTTLLAMVDAAIGGKVAVNHPQQKNLIGSFYQSSEVLICSEFTRTLPETQIRSSLGEVLKMALVSSPELMTELETFDISKPSFDTIIRICVENKIRILGENCYERSLERTLNLGHCVGHPIEDISKFQIPHGCAVAMGIAFAAFISYQRRQLSSDDLSRILDVMKHLQLQPFDATIDPDTLWEHISRVVLQRGGKGLLFVMPTGIGTTTIINTIKRDEFDHAIGSLMKLI